MKEAFEQGYYLAEAIFSPDDLATIEFTLGCVPDDVIQIYRNEKIIRYIAHALCGPDLTDTNEAVVHYNPTRIYDKWHYDIPWDSEDGDLIPCWRFAVYFRDYTTHSGALAVVPGSHLGKIDNTPPTKAHVIQSRPGDVVIWNLRTRHKPNAQIEGRPQGTPRNAIIFDYAAPGIEVERYKAWRLPKRIAEGRA